MGLLGVGTGLSPRITEGFESPMLRHGRLIAFLIELPADGRLRECTSSLPPAHVKRAASVAPMGCWEGTSNLLPSEANPRQPWSGGLVWFRAPACHAGDLRGFKSRPLRHSSTGCCKPGIQCPWTQTLVFTRTASGVTVEGNFCRALDLEKCCEQVIPDLPGIIWRLVPLGEPRCWQSVNHPQYAAWTP